MLNLGIILAILLIGLSNLSGATDYCDPKLCPSFGNHANSHIGCNNNGKFAENCEEPSIIGMTSYLADAILFTHNDLRNKVANGSLPRFQSAKRMTTFSWDSELQYLAGLNILRCELKHDECHNTKEYKWSGQNLGIIHKSVPFSQSEYKQIVVDFIKEWFNEHRNAVQGDVDMCIGNAKHDRRIGHFTQLVQEKTSKLGCSVVTFSTSVDQRTWSSLLMACDYSYGNLIDWPIYKKGPMASDCLTGPHPNFNGLCSARENVPPVPDWHEKLGGSSAVAMSQSSVKLVPSRQSEQLPLNIFQSAPSSHIDSSVSADGLFPTVPMPRGFDWPDIGSSGLPSRDSQNSENRPSFSRRVSHPRTSRPFRASTVRRFSRRHPPPQARYRDLVQPLMPIPVVTWRGPVYNKNQTTRPASTQQTQVASHRDQTAYKRIVPNVPVRSNDIIQPVPVVRWNGSRIANQQGRTAYKRVVPNVPVRSNDIIQPVPVVTWNSSLTTTPGITRRTGTQQDQTAYNRVVRNPPKPNAVAANQGPHRRTTLLVDVDTV